jgi:hypothetical protein
MIFADKCLFPPLIPMKTAARKAVSENFSAEICLSVRTGKTLPPLTPEKNGFRQLFGDNFFQKNYSSPDSGCR